MYELTSGPEANTFRFTTVSGVTYEVEFITLDELTFPELRHPERFFLVDVHPLQLPWDTLPAEDNSIGETICFVIQQIMQETNVAIVYSCETTDGREKARYRKFNQWFIRCNDGTFLKYDAEITSATNQYFVSVLVRHSPDSYQIAQDFLTLTTAWQERKAS